jgi:hypothetical protein
MPAKKTTKTTKKAAVKAVKKPAVKAVKKVAVKAAPVKEPKCECGENCHCHHHGRTHLVKHILVWAIIFALGMLCGKMVCCHAPKHMSTMQPVFVNGCLDMTSISCPKVQEKLATADVDANDCISVEEFKAVKKEVRKEMRKAAHEEIRAHRKGLFGKKPVHAHDVHEAPEAPVAE